MKSDYERRHSRWYEQVLLGLPFHLIAGLAFAALIPSFMRWGWAFWHYLPDERTNTVIAITLSFIGILLTLRRLTRFPGAQVVAYIAPTVTAIFLLAIAILFFTREAYTRQVLFGGYALSMLWFFIGYFLGKRYRKLKIAVVPLGEAIKLKGTRQVELRPLNEPDLHRVRYDGIVADLHAEELGSEWEKFLAKCTLSGIPVYHIKQLKESITGRVRIDHLSENEFGSLLPSGFYGGFKRAVDFFAVLLMLPLAMPIMLITVILIRLDSRGPALFIQPRMGYRGLPFRVYKFRSMHCDKKGRGFTEGEDDPRITRIGRVIRKYRIDELPQLFNVLKGEMSFIGPRPESMELSEWYEKDVPFFSYRHIVRPGISGWAQVEQGYAAEVDGMIDKLQYDFYYIKHFSLWIDVLIIFKTLKTVVTGFGSR